MNHKRVYHIYCDEGLNLRYRKKTYRISLARIKERAVTKANEYWAMDFVSDSLFNGRRFRALTLMDVFTRECLAIFVNQGFRGKQIAPLPENIKTSPPLAPDNSGDNGPEFIFKVYKADFGPMKKSRLPRFRDKRPTYVFLHSSKHYPDFGLLRPFQVGHSPCTNIPFLRFCLGNLPVGADHDR